MLNILEKVGAASHCSATPLFYHQDNITSSLETCPLMTIIILSAAKPRKVAAFSFCTILIIEDTVRFQEHKYRHRVALIKSNVSGWRVMMRIRRIIWERFLKLLNYEVRINKLCVLVAW